MPVVPLIAAGLSGKMLTVVVFLVILLAVAVILRRMPRAQRADEYERIEALFSPAEVAFLRALDAAVGDRYRVFAKVRLTDLVRPRPGLTKKAWQTARNRIDRKHVDYVLCNAENLSPFCAIELDDSSHKRQSRRERDAQVDRILKECGLPLVRVAAQRSYDITILRRAVLTGLAGPITNEPSSATTIISGPRSVEETQILPPDYHPSAQPSPQPSPAPVRPAGSDSPACPQCGGPMTLKKARRGQNAGNSFWGCNKYPDCRGTLPA